jgi:hypothetical protein
LGFSAASTYADSIARERGEKWRDTALRRLRTPAANAFEACLPFPSIGGVVWAIDPARRVLRAIAPGVPNGEQSFVWDEPIRAVEIRRGRRAGSSSNVFDCDLLIRSGSDSASEWTYIFEFPGPYRETATRWHKVFEDWMIEDERRMAT